MIKKVLLSTILFLPLLSSCSSGPSILLNNVFEIPTHHKKERNVSDDILHYNTSVTLKNIYNLELSSFEESSFKSISLFVLLTYNGMPGIDFDFDYYFKDAKLYVDIDKYTLSSVYENVDENVGSSYSYFVSLSLSNCSYLFLVHEGKNEKVYYHND